MSSSSEDRPSSSSSSTARRRMPPPPPTSTSTGNGDAIRGKRRRKRPRPDADAEETGKVAKKAAETPCRLCANVPDVAGDEDDEDAAEDPVAQVEMQLLEVPSGLRAHYLCLLFSSGLHQRGGEDDGLKGFLPRDVQSEVRRGNRLKCVYCKKKGATVGCARGSCKRSYHLPCGIRNDALQQHFDQFKSFCSTHRPVQKVGSNSKRALAECGICLKEVTAPKASFKLLHAPCCGGWMHRTCIQRQALSSGLHHFRCIYCNDDRVFVKEMRNFGIQIPERDASWEKNGGASSGAANNAFGDITAPRRLHCSAKICLCPRQRRWHEPDGLWEVLACAGCGSRGIHARCGGLEEYVDPDWYCYTCRRVVDVKRESWAKPIRAVWGAAAATADGSKPRSPEEQKKEMLRVIETTVTPVLQAKTSTTVQNADSHNVTSTTAQSAVSHNVSVYETNVSVRVRQDPMSVTLEDLINQGLDSDKQQQQQTARLLAPPPSKRPRLSGDSSKTSSSSSDQDELRLKSSSPGDSDYESGRENVATTTPAKKVPIAARESLDEKIQRSIKDFFMEG